MSFCLRQVFRVPMQINCHQGKGWETIKFPHTDNIFARVTYSTRDTLLDIANAAEEWPKKGVVPQGSATEHRWGAHAAIAVCRKERWNRQELQSA